MSGQMQMSVLGFRLWKILGAFFIGSVFTGSIFGLCITRPALHGYWFRTEEIWTFPTGKLWLLASGLFITNLIVPYLIVHLNKWLRFSTYRLIFGGMLFVMLPISIWLIEPLSALSQLLVFRFTLAVVTSLVVFVITQTWHWLLATLMTVLSVTTSIIAGIAYIFFNSISFEWFEVSKFFINSAVLAVLFGYWLVKARPVGRLVA